MYRLVPAHPRLSGLVILLVTMLIPAERPALAAGDAPAPPDGFPTIRATEQLTLSDGYQLLVEVRYPDPAVHPPGPCGWPGIVWVHTLFSNRFGVTPFVREMSSRGYLTISYDVRGHEPSMSLNDPAIYGFTGGGLRERIDLAEVIEEIGNRYPMDADRVGVTGASLGAIHAWYAAAHSGRTFPPNPWRTEPFPEIACAIPRFFPPDLVAPTFPEGTVHTRVMRNIFQEAPTLHIDPVVDSFLRTHILNEDFAAIRSVLDCPGLDIPTLLQDTEVPVLADLAYDDVWGPVNSGLDFWLELPRSVPRRLVLHTGGHNTPGNEQHTGLFRRLMFRWFDRFLKGIDNGVDQEKNLYIGITPEDPVVYQDVQSLWDFREIDLDPPGGYTINRYYLRQDGGLTLPRPGPTEGEDSVRQTNPTGLNMAVYSEWLPSPEELFPVLPLDTVTFDTEPLTEDLHLLGHSRARLHLRSENDTYQVHAAVYVVFPDDTERFIADGLLTFRGDGAGEHYVNIPIYVHSMMVRAGQRIRMKVENLALHNPPVAEPRIQYAPVFNEFEVAVLHDAEHPSFLDLGSLASSDPRLVAYDRLGSQNPLTDFPFTVHTSSAHADWNLVLLISLSGTSPGTESPRGFTVPLNVDDLTFSALDIAPAPPFERFVTLLGPTGSATPILRESFLDTLPGSVHCVDLAAVVFLNGDFRVSNSTRVELR